MTILDGSFSDIINCWEAAGPYSEKFRIRCCGISDDVCDDYARRRMITRVFLAGEWNLKRCCFSFVIFWSVIVYYRFILYGVVRGGFAEMVQ